VSDNVFIVVVLRGSARAGKPVLRSVPGVAPRCSRNFPPQHSTSVMAPLPPGVAYLRSPPRKPEFPCVSTPWEGEAPAEPQTQPLAEPLPEAPAATSPSPNPPAAHRHPEPPGETAATEPLKWLKEQPCGTWAIRNLGSSSPGIQPIPARPRGWRGGFT